MYHKTDYAIDATESTQTILSKPNIISTTTRASSLVTVEVSFDDASADLAATLTWYVGNDISSTVPMDTLVEAVSISQTNNKAVLKVDNLIGYFKYIIVTTAGTATAKVRGFSEGV